MAVRGSIPALRLFPKGAGSPLRSCFRSEGRICAARKRLDLPPPCPAVVSSAG